MYIIYLRVQGTIWHIPYLGWEALSGPCLFWDGAGIEEVILEAYDELFLVNWGFIM